MPYTVERSARFVQEAQELLGDRWESVVKGLEWFLRRGADTGQKVRGSHLRVWPSFPGDGYAYIVYYEISDYDEVILHSMLRRQTPVAPQLFDLED